MLYGWGCVYEAVGCVMKMRNRAQATGVKTAVLGENGEMVLKLRLV